MRQSPREVTWNIIGPVHEHDVIVLLKGHDDLAFADYVDEFRFQNLGRDDRLDYRVATKKIYRLPLAKMKPAPLDAPALPVATKDPVHDLLPDLKSTGGYVLDKVEGLAITEDGTARISTDNDGVDDHFGETLFFSVGRF